MTDHYCRYFYGWWMWCRTLYKVRTKKHGAGAMAWGNAFKMAACTRYLVDGQHRGSKGPRYLRGISD